jgi:dTDP-4-dehydrorhamnose reductase
LMKMVQAELSGLYHVVSPECISKYEFGRAIANLFGFDTNLITPISVEQGGLAARRSPHLTLLPDKLQQDLRMELPGQEIGLKHFYDLERVNYPAMLRELAG